MMALSSFALPGFRPGIVSLEANGMIYEGWLAAEVSRSVREMAGQFSFEVSERWSGGRDGPAALLGWRIREGDPCVVRYSGVPVLTGYVDTYCPRYDADSHTVRIQGRSKTADMVDSAADPDVPTGEMRKVTLDQVANKLALPHGVKVKVQADIKDAFDVIRTLPGETKHEMLERYARHRAAALTDDTDGSLRILQVQDGAPVATLTEGVNILEASATLRADNRYSDYEVKGQDHGDDERWGREISEISAKVKDGAIKRYRPHVVVDDVKTAKIGARKRCEWECASRSGESTKVQIKVVDWFRAPGALWMPGDLVQVTSPMLAINRVLAVENVAHQQSDRGGTTTDLSLVPPEALNPKAASAQGGPGSGDSAGSVNDQRWSSTKPSSMPLLQ